MQKVWAQPPPADTRAPSARFSKHSQGPDPSCCAGRSQPTSPPAAERCGAPGRTSRLRPAHAARLHFYGGRTIAEVWRVAVCRRDNRGFLFIATLSTCRWVRWAGPRRAWGSPGCPARGGLGRVPLLLPSERASYTGAVAPAARLPVIPPLPDLAHVRSSRGGWKEHLAAAPSTQPRALLWDPSAPGPKSLGNGARNPCPRAPSTGRPERS